MRLILMMLLLLPFVSGCVTTYVYHRMPILNCYQDPPPTEVKANAKGHLLIEQLRTTNSANLKECEEYNRFARKWNKDHDVQ